MSRNASSCPAEQPLAGLTVVEIGHSVAAPYAGQVLGDLGARVVKIENPKGGDDARTWGPPFWNGASSMFQTLNRNKLSAVVDLKDERQREKLIGFIVRRADIVVQNQRAGLLDGLGLGATRMRARAPRLIYCNLAAFGARGPLVDQPGYDPLMQAFGGLMSVTGEAGRPAVRIGPSIIDQGAGMWCVIGILAALHRRNATGEGAIVDTSLFETALGWMNSHASFFAASGAVPGRRGSEQPTLVPYKVFEARDGEVMIACGNDNLFRRLAGALNRSDWLDDVRFSTNPARVTHRELVNAAVQVIVAEKPVAHWVDALQRSGVPVAPIQTIDRVLAHPQTEALQMLQPTPDGRMELMGLPLSFNLIRPGIRLGPPAHGHDTPVIVEGENS